MSRLTYAEGYEDGRFALRKEIAKKLRALKTHENAYVYASDIVALIEELEAE